MKSKLSENPNARHFQIQWLDSKGSGSFSYFSVEPGQKVEDCANACANNWLDNRYENNFFGTFKPLKSAKVVEYDCKKHQTLRGGLKFKIRLNFIQAKTQNMFTRQNHTIHREWYEADSIGQ